MMEERLLHRGWRVVLCSIGQKPFYAKEGRVMIDEARSFQDGGVLKIEKMRVLNEKRGI